jgi:hypothetical protein
MAVAQRTEADDAGFIARDRTDGQPGLTVRVDRRLSS